MLILPYFALVQNGANPFMFLDNAKPLLSNALPLLLADGIALLPRGATINGAAAAAPKGLRHVRRHPVVPALAYEFRRVEALVAAPWHAPASRKFLQVG